MGRYDEGGGSQRKIEHDKNETGSEKVNYKYVGRDKRVRFGPLLLPCSRLRYRFGIDRPPRTFVVYPDAVGRGEGQEAAVHASAV